MGRRLRVRLIALKQELYAKKARLQDKKAAINADLAECSLDQKASFYEAKHKAIDEYLCAQREVNRAAMYGHLYANDVIFTCVPCFVFHDILLSMKSTKPVVAGIKRYKCGRCGEELNEDQK